MLQFVVPFLLLLSQLRPIMQISFVIKHGQLTFINFIVQNLGEFIKSGDAYLGFKAVDNVL